MGAPIRRTDQSDRIPGYRFDQRAPVGASRTLLQPGSGQLRRAPLPRVLHEPVIGSGADRRGAAGR